MDEIPSELLKEGGQTIVKELFVLLDKCWTKERVTGEWKRGVIVKQPGKTAKGCV